CLVDDDVDLVQAVLQHRDADRGPQQDEPETLQDRQDRRPRGNGREEQEDHEGRRGNEPLELLSLVASRPPEPYDNRGERADERADYGDDEQEAEGSAERRCLTVWVASA